MKLKGTIKAVGKAVTREYQRDGQTKSFTYRNFWVEDEDENQRKYNAPYEFQLTGQKIDAVDGFEAGDKVEVTFDIGSRKREWKDRETGKTRSMIVTTLKAWAVNHQSATPTASVGASDTLGEGGDEDLPF